MEPESELFAIEGEEQGDVTAAADVVGETVAQGTVLFPMREMRTTLRKELQDLKSDMIKILEMQKNLMGKMVTLDTAVQGLGDSGLIQAVPSGPSRRGRYRTEPTLEFLSATFSDSNASVPLIQLACIITTTSLSKRIPALQGLVSEGVVNYLGPLQDVCRQATGFGTLIFAVRGNAAKNKFRFATGRIWLFWLKPAMNAAIAYAKKYMYFEVDDTSPQATGEFAGAQQTVQLPQEPAWLTSLDTVENIGRVVHEAVQRFEALERTTPTTSSFSNASSPPPKRPRTEDIADPCRICDLQRRCKLGEYLLPYGRAEVRSYLYLKLFFIVDRIKDFADRNVARSSGFDVIFSLCKSELELHPAGLSGIWNIPLARIGDPATQRSSDFGFEENMRILETLQDNFPCLSLEIKYKRDIKQAAGGLDRDGRRLSVEPIMWSHVDRISLHVVAVHMIMELVSAKSIDVVLAASTLSLRTVHTLAIGLRALLLRSLESVEKKSTEFSVTNSGLTDLERNVLGNVVCEHISKTADLVSVNMDEVKAGGKQAVRLATNREKKLSMSFEEYAEAVEEAERARTAAAETAEVSPTQPRALVNVRNLNDDWLVGG